jgi:hypothetical protein
MSASDIVGQHIEIGGISFGVTVQLMLHVACITMMKRQLGYSNIKQRKTVTENYCTKVSPKNAC